MCFIVTAISFDIYFGRKNKIKRGKIQSLNFAESNVHGKTNARGSFETEFFLFGLLNALGV